MHARGWIGRSTWPPMPAGQICAGQRNAGQRCATRPPQPCADLGGEAVHHGGAPRLPHRLAAAHGQALGRIAQQLGKLALQGWPGVGAG